MIQCTNCQDIQNLVKAGFVRGKQRFLCKSCDSYFTVQTTPVVPAKKNHQTTIVDIAKALGVAPSTVSRALNNSKEINENTRQEILRVAQELDYRPNLLAQSLNRGATNTIGVVIPDIQRPFFAGVLSGIQQVASNAGYRVMICQSNESHSTETLNVQALMSSQVDGLLISHSVETTSFEHIKLHLNRGIPIVHFDRVAYELSTAKVILDNFRGSYLLVEHLIQQGCKKIAICAGPKDLLISQERFEGYQAALKEYGLIFDQNLVYHIGFRKNEAVDALNQWLSLESPPDAIFAVHHGNAIELMVELKKRGIKIPEQIAIAGFGDDQIAELIEPALTVFHQFPLQVGEIAANTLISNIIDGDNFVPEDIIVQGKLVVRKSSVKI